MKKEIAVFLLLMAAASTAQEHQKPYAMKEDVLWESSADYKQNNPRDCLNDGNNPYAKRELFAGTFYSPGWCLIDGPASGESVDKVVDMTYAGISLKRKQVVFNSEHLVEIIATFNHDAYSQLREALVRKYGRPTGRIAKDIQTLTGAHFTGELLTWTNGVSIIQLDEYSGNINDTSLDFVLSSYLNLKKKVSQEQIQKNVKSDM